MTSARLSPALRGSLYYTLYWGVVGVYYPFAGVYFAGLGFSGGEIGLLYALLPLMALLAGPPVSFLADRHARRVRVLTFALAALAPVTALLTFPRTFWGILPLLALLALFRSAAEPLADALVARMAAAHRLHYGGMRLWGSLSFAAVALLFGVLWERVGFGLIFAVTGLLFLPVAFAGAGLEEVRPARQAAPTPFWQVGRDPGLLALFAASGFVGASLGVFNAFSGVYLADLGGGEGLVGALFALSALCELPTMRLADRMLGGRSGVTVLLLGYALLTLSYLGYGLAEASALLLLFGAVKGLGFGLFFVGTVRLVDVRTPAQWSSTFQSLVMGAAAFGLGGLIASPLGGLLYDAVSPRSVFLACALLPVVAALVLLAARGAFAPRFHPEGF